MSATQGILRKFKVRSRSMRWRTHVLFVVVLLFAGIDSHPSEGSDQQSSPPQTQSPVYQSSTVLRATTRLVVVDVVATDNKGEPVLDLKANDFTVLEDGKTQKISGFSFQQGTPVTQVSASAGAVGFSNAPQYKNVNSLNVMLFDAWNGDCAGQAYGSDELTIVLVKRSLTHT